MSQRGFNRNVRKASIELKKRQAIYFEELTKSEKLELEKRSNYAEWNYSAEVFAFGKRLKEDFKPELLTKAFIQR